MAQIWRTVTGTFSVTGVKKATNTATQASTYDYQSSGYVGTAKNNGTNTSYALFCRPNEGDIFSVSDTAEILSMTMKVRMKRKNTWQLPFTIIIKGFCIKPVARRACTRCLWRARTTIRTLMP